MSAVILGPCACKACGRLVLVTDRGLCVPSKPGKRHRCGPWNGRVAPLRMTEKGRDWLGRTAS